MGGVGGWGDPHTHTQTQTHIYVRCQRDSVQVEKVEKKIWNNKIPKHKIVTPANNDHT